MRKRWKQVERLFEQVADLVPAEREAALRALCGDDTALRKEVSSLAASVEGAEEFLASRIASGGSVLGNYRLIREIGAGGMGTVYLAVRGDGQFRQQVAIKVARRGLPAEWTRERFRQERQMMADLAHPHIARLLDGGATSDGIPYLVMEYIEGQPITMYAVSLALRIEERLRLFLGVCDAVAYAHRNLVVHRDLKPGNILVTSTGTPKLLDFGISKLLGPTAPVEGGLTLNLMTPEYASPEQLRGEAVNTTSDVYSLGAVLNELLTCDLVTARLPRDLQAIVEMAMRAEAERRYSSAEHLAADVERYLEHRPVAARKGAGSYRLSKFVRRHRMAVVAAVLLAATLIGGIAAVAWQAHRVAVQVGRAERRFAQFQKLAKTFLFDFHTRIQGMQNLGEARELVLNTGLEYVDQLAKDAGDDPQFARELARAYDQFGNLQGFRHEAAMSRPAAALASYRKAIALLEPERKRDATAALLLSRCWCNAGEVSARMAGGAEEAKRSYRKCLDAALEAPRATRLTSTNRTDLLFRAHGLLGDLELAEGNPAGARAHYAEIRRMTETLEITPEWRRLTRLAELNRRLAGLRKAYGDRAGAVTLLRTAREQARQAAALSGDIGVARSLGRVLRDLAAERTEFRAEAVEAARRVTARLPHHPEAAEELAAALALGKDSKAR